MNLALCYGSFYGFKVIPDNISSDVAEYLPIEPLEAGFVGVLEQTAGNGVIGSHEVAVCGIDDLLLRCGDLLIGNGSCRDPIVMQVWPPGKEFAPCCGVPAGTVLEYIDHANQCLSPGVNNHLGPQAGISFHLHYRFRWYSVANDTA